VGEQYQETIEQKISELGAKNLRVFINADGLSPHYRQHLENTFRDAGVQFVSNHDEANLVFEGSRFPEPRAGQVVAYFKESQLMFAGGL